MRRPPCPRVKLDDVLTIEPQYSPSDSDTPLADQADVLATWLLEIIAREDAQGAEDEAA